MSDVTVVRRVGNDDVVNERGGMRDARSILTLIIIIRVQFSDAQIETTLFNKIRVGSLRASPICTIHII